MCEKIWRYGRLFIGKLREEKIIFAINPRTNYLIEQVKPYLIMLDEDDRHVLLAIFEGCTDEISIKKYFNTIISLATYSRVSSLALVVKVVTIFYLVAF